MGYVLQYSPDAQVVASATAAGYGATAAEEQRRYAEQQARANDELDFRYDQLAVDTIQRQQAMDDSNYQFNAQLGQQGWQQDANNQLAWAGVGINQQQVDQGYAQLEQQGIRDQLGFMSDQSRIEAGLTAEEMQIVARQAAATRREKIDMAMDLGRRIDQAARDGEYRNQAQYEAAKAQARELTGIDATVLERTYADQQITMEREKRAAAVNGYSKETGMSPEEIDHHLIDDGNGRYVLDDPDFVAKMATNKTDNARMMAIADQNNAAKVETTRAKAIEDYHNLRRETETKIRLRYAELLKDEANARSQKANVLAGRNDDVTVRPDQLPDDVKNQLKRQAISEFPMTAPPPEMQ
jgi:hypothetical protein